MSGSKKKVPLKLPDLGPRTSGKKGAEPAAVPAEAAANIEKWSTEGAPVQETPAPEEDTASPKKRGRKARAEGARPKEKMTIHMEPELADKLRVSCALKRKSLSDAVAEACEAMLAGEPPPRL